jgi:enolase
MDALNQIEVDKVLIDLDGTPNKGTLGANAILGVSLATAKAVADTYSIPLYRYIGGVGACEMPVPMANILNGGSHSDAPIDLQEYMIMPVGAPSFTEGIRYVAEIFAALKKILKDRKLSTAVGDEGGFAPDLEDNEAPLRVIVQAIEKAGYKPGIDIMIAMDPAASEFYDTDKKRYIFSKSDKTGAYLIQMVDFYIDLMKKYPIISIEDGMAEDDWTGGSS